jgi:phosphatidylglycerol:prolipoprotein diacylglycerol transferase
VRPIAFHIGGLTLHTYGLLAALGFLAVVAIGFHHAKVRGWPREAMIDLIVVSALAGLLGSRALFLVQNPNRFEGIHSLWAVRDGGLVFYGAPLLGVPLALGYARSRQLPIRGVMDAFGRSAPVGHALSRLGCWAAGCCYGIPATGVWSRWGLLATDPHSLTPHDVPRVPVQVFEAAALGLLAVAIHGLARRPHREGSLFWAWMLGYAVLRLATETLRGDADRGFYGPFSTSTWISLGCLALGAVGWWVGRGAQVGPVTSPADPAPR